MKTLPMYTVDLVKELDKLYPDTFMVDSFVEEDYWKLAGKIELIRFLKSKSGTIINDKKA